MGASDVEEVAVEATNECEVQKTFEQPVSTCQPKFFVTVSRRTGLRRLHAHFRCPVRALRCLDSFDVNSIDESTFDVMCRICKRRLMVEEGRQESESSSSTGDSSSTESEKAPEALEEQNDWAHLG